MSEFQANPMWRIRKFRRMVGFNKTAIIVDIFTYSLIRKKLSDLKLDKCMALISVVVHSSI